MKTIGSNCEKGDRFIASRSDNIAETYLTSQQLESSLNIDNAQENKECVENESEENLESFTSFLQQKILGVDVCACAYLRSWNTNIQNKTGSKCECIFPSKEILKARCSVLNGKQKNTREFEKYENKFKSSNRSQKKEHIISIKIPKNPYKVLDAPQLRDDYYLNLLDWSEKDVLAVGLGKYCYLWSAKNMSVSKLTETKQDNHITALSWNKSGEQLSIGSLEGTIQLWDVESRKLTREFSGHSARVGAIAMTDNLLASGSRDKRILLHDLRMKYSLYAELKAHKQEICGLKWNESGKKLASGGNDNKLMIWSHESVSSPLFKMSDHKAAVKAITWSPHKDFICVSGGGTQDQTIRFWNTLTGEQIKCINTGSQVCNLTFSKNVNQFVSTHGYSQNNDIQNQICVWNFPSDISRRCQKIASLTGHQTRVLYIAQSPNGENIATGAGDETLRFWKVFPPKQYYNTKSNSIIDSIAYKIR